MQGSILRENRIVKFSVSYLGSSDFQTSPLVWIKTLIPGQSLYWVQEQNTFPLQSLSQPRCING